MGEGYAVLVWDGYGVGLHRINPRLIELYDDWGDKSTNKADAYTGLQSQNWVPIRDPRGMTDEQIDEAQDLTKRFGRNWQIIR